MLNDLLKSRGKYSRKSLIIIISFLFILVTGGYIVIADTCTTQAVDVFNSMLLFESVLLGIATLDKKLTNKTEEKTE